MPEICISMRGERFNPKYWQQSRCLTLAGVDFFIDSPEAIIALASELTELYAGLMEPPKRQLPLSVTIQTAK